MTENKKYEGEEIPKEDQEQNNIETDMNMEEMDSDGDDRTSSEIEDLRRRLTEKEKESNEYLDLARRTKAEFENFRRRTLKEKESLYDDGFSEAVKNFFPILDNLERAVSFNTSERNSLTEGVEMVLKIFKDTLSKLGIEEIEDVGHKFDPDYHNAVMHVEDETLEDNVIVEVLQKGYKYKNKVLRYSMVKVAN